MTDARPHAHAAPAPHTAVAGERPSVFRTERLTKCYRRRGAPPVLATDAVTFEVRQGEVFGLLGANGAGKTTLVRQLVGLLRPDAGEIALFGRDLVRDPRLASRYVAYLPQDEGVLADLPVGTAIEVTARMRGLSRRAARAARESLLAELELGALAGRPIGAMSGGQRRLAAVATALAGDRPVLVLDEPTTGLDADARRRVWRAIHHRRTHAGATVVLVTHNVLEAETVLDRVAIMKAGNVAACDTPGALKAATFDQVRLDLVWRDEEPPDDPYVERLRASARINGRRWSVRLPADDARAALAHLSGGPLLAALDDFALATPSLEEAYLALGGATGELDRE